MIGAGAVEDNRKPARTIDYLKRHKYAVSVMVVNLYYDNPDLVPYRGFGYLIPRSVPIEQNPERGLGVIFGSDSSVGQDTAPGTKLTVMMGGHWWDDWLESDLPDPETATLMACSLLKRHLGITDSPSTTTARFQRDAIPQYTVGHLTRMENLSEAVRDEFNGRLTLAGNWYNMHGIGVLNSITQAYLAASYGVGASRPSFPEQVEKELNQFNFHSWDLEGGIATAPVRYFNASQAAWSSIYSE
jgi:oxygen-dependent protoporphyrinogen oxidase